MNRSSRLHDVRVPPEVEDAAKGLSVIIIQTCVGDFGAYLRRNGKLVALALGRTPVSALKRALAEANGPLQ